MKFKGGFFSWYTISAYSFFIVLISLSPFRAPEQLTFPFSDKIFHCLTYTLLAFVAVNTFYLKRKRRPRFLSFVYAFSLGCLVELIQAIVPYRDFETADILFNFLGSIVGCFLKII